jgi:hypothetical protein
MTRYFTSNPVAFYAPEIHGAAIPTGAVEISDAEHAALIEGQAAGQIIAAGPDGRPQLQPRPVPDEAELLEIERQGMRCSRFQARAALHQAGLLPAIEAAVAAAPALVQIAWADATEFRRDSPTIAALAAGLGMTEAAIDDLFRVAMTITA